MSIQTWPYFDENTISNSSQLFIGDVLDNNLNGLNYFQQGGYGTVSGIQLRGQPKRYSTVYIDGVKMSDPSSVSNDYDFNHILTSQISRVEILKGNQSSIYGSGAIGGTITNTIFCSNNCKIITMVSPCFLDINYRMKYLLKDSDFIYGELDCNEGEIPKNVRVKITD